MIPRTIVLYGHISELVFIIILVHVEIIEELLKIIKRHPENTVFFSLFNKDVLIPNLLFNLFSPELRVIRPISNPFCVTPGIPELNQFDFLTILIDGTS